MRERGRGKGGRKARRTEERKTIETELKKEEKKKRKERKEKGKRGADPSLSAASKSSIVATTEATFSLCASDGDVGGW